MLINVPTVDYLRLTSFDRVMIGEFHKLVLRRKDIDHQARWGKNYKGIRSGQVFAGVAEQKNKIHGLLDVSGLESHQLMSFEAPRGNEVKCTRIDLQVTIDLVQQFEYRARNFKDALESANWKDASGSRLHKRDARLIEGPSEYGLDTVYIGSRSSERYVRVYVKEDIKENQYLRFEAEFTGKRADAVFTECINDGRNVAAILRGEWERIPPVEIPTWIKIGAVLAEYTDGKHISIPRSAGDNNSRYVWFTKSVVPALGTLLNDHNCGYLVRRTLEELLANAL